MAGKNCPKCRGIMMPCFCGKDRCPVCETNSSKHGVGKCVPDPSKRRK